MFDLLYLFICVTDIHKCVYLGSSLKVSLVPPLSLERFSLDQLPADNSNIFEILYVYTKTILKKAKTI